MRVLSVVLCLASFAAWAQPAAHFELAQLRAERDAVSLAQPVTVTFVGLGALTTGLLFDAATANQRRGGVSVLGFACYAVASTLVLPALLHLVSKLLERGMLDGHIRQLEREWTWAP